MAGKKLPKDVDLANNVDVAAGFFSNPNHVESKTDKQVQTTAPLQTTKKPSTNKIITEEKKNLGGRPKKDGLKNEQFTLTMNPETYEKLRIIAQKHTDGNFSRLIALTINSFCKEHNIDLDAVQVEPEILEMYKKKQEKKSKK